MSFTRLESLYKIVPGVPCIAGCKGCCVSPTITLTEFIYMMRYLLKTYKREIFLKFITYPMRPHPQFEGNYYCRFQSENGYCGLHEGRALACRLHGLPVIEDLGIKNLENCTIMDKSECPQVNVKEINGWIDELLLCNQELRPDYGDEFHHIIGLNVECWLDIAFWDNISSNIIRNLQNLIRSLLPEDLIINGYLPHTEISEKIDAVSLLEMLINSGDKDAVENILDHLQNKYPTAGTYFSDDASWIREKLKKPEY